MSGEPSGGSTGSFCLHPEVATATAGHKAPAAQPAPARVIGQLGQSLDGRIATASGESKYINGMHSLAHLHSLRASVDAVVVGVGTVVADDPLLTVRHVAGRSPARVVLDPSGRVDPQARCFAADGARRVVVRRGRGGRPLPEGVETLVLPGEAAFAPAAVIAGLREMGFSRLLVEGGARTLAAFLDAACIDELHVFVSPVILGSGRQGLALSGRETLASALRPAARARVFPDGDVLFELDLRAAAGDGLGTSGRDARGPGDQGESEDHEQRRSRLRAAG